MVHFAFKLSSVVILMTITMCELCIQHFAPLGVGLGAGLLAEIVSFMRPRLQAAATVGVVWPRPKSVCTVLIAWQTVSFSLTVAVLLLTV